MGGGKGIPGDQDGVCNPQEEPIKGGRLIPTAKSHIVSRVTQMSPVSMNLVQLNSLQFQFSSFISAHPHFELRST